VTGPSRRRTGFVHILSDFTDIDFTDIDFTDLFVDPIIQITSSLPIRASLPRVVSLTD
jgi:hypothetical protein